MTNFRIFANIRRPSSTATTIVGKSSSRKKKKKKKGKEKKETVSLAVTKKENVFFWIFLCVEFCFFFVFFLALYRLERYRLLLWLRPIQRPSRCQHPHLSLTSNSPQNQCRSSDFLLHFTHYSRCIVYTIASHRHVSLPVMQLLDHLHLALRRTSRNNLKKEITMYGNFRASSKTDRHTSGSAGRFVRWSSGIESNWSAVMRTPLWSISSWCACWTET